MAMTPAQRHKIREMYEKQQQDRKNSRLGIKPQKTKKGKRK
jgi:hypothetical protein